MHTKGSWAETADIERSQFGNHAEWNSGLAMEAEEGTRGLYLELCYHRLRRERFAGRCFPSKSWPYICDHGVEYGSPMKKDVMSDTQILGSISIFWSQLQFSKPVRSMVLDLLPVKLDVSISVTPSQPGPKLLRALRSPVTDDSCKRIAILIDLDAPLQSGRWTTKIVVNYTGKPLYVIRTRYVTLGYNCDFHYWTSWILVSTLSSIKRGPNFSSGKRRGKFRCRKQQSDYYFSMCCLSIWQNDWIQNADLDLVSKLAWRSSSYLYPHWSKYQVSFCLYFPCRSAHLASGAPASLQCNWEDTIVQIHQAECVSDGVTSRLPPWHSGFNMFCLVLFLYKSF